MKKLFLIFALLTLTSICGCSIKSEDYTEASSQVVVYPDEETKISVNGYKKFSDSQNVNSSAETEISETYCVNIKTKKFHKSDCRYAVNSNQENIRTEQDRNLLISEGYSPCKVCKP